MDIINLVLIAILIALTAFFVATEFAIVKVRSTRVDQLIEEGKPNALSAKKVISNLDEYLSTCQLGITVTALGLGLLGEPTVENILHPLLNQLNLPNSASHALLGCNCLFFNYLHTCGCWGIGTKNIGNSKSGAS